ncbi:hypothetical protein STENM327S_07774 [Streptomyces tendae]
MIEPAGALVRHRLRVYRVNEQMSSNAKLQVKTVVHLTDYGSVTDRRARAQREGAPLTAAEGDTEAVRRGPDAPRGHSAVL